jgi:hypothetical protein
LDNNLLSLISYDHDIEMIPSYASTQETQLDEKVFTPYFSGVSSRLISYSEEKLSITPKRNEELKKSKEAIEDEDSFC